MNQPKIGGTLIAALALLTPLALAQGQDTTQSTTSQQAATDSATQDSTIQLVTPSDSSADIQNSQGYREMERPTDTLPSDSVTGQDRPADAVKDSARGTGTDSVTVTDSATVTDSVTVRPDSIAKKKRAAAQPDSSKWGNPVNRDPDVKNPPGYRGMERPVNVFPPDSGETRDSSDLRDTPAAAGEDRATPAEDSSLKDTTAAQYDSVGAGKTGNEEKDRPEVEAPQPQ